MSIEIEIEKKFLLKSVPNVKYDDVINITQYYLKDSDARYRKSEHLNKDIKYYKTTKTYISVGTNKEEEMEISESDYINAIKDGNKYINKIRHIYYIDNLKWEIDEFKDIDIVIAEIELPYLNYKFKTPSWLKKEIIMDVTKYEKFGNKNLAKNV